MVYFIHCTFANLYHQLILIYDFETKYYTTCSDGSKLFVFSIIYYGLQLTVDKSNCLYNLFGTVKPVSNTIWLTVATPTNCSVTFCDVLCRDFAFLVFRCCNGFRLSVCPSVRHNNFNLAHIFWSINDTVMLFGMHDPCYKPFHLTQCRCKIKFWPPHWIPTRGHYSMDFSLNNDPP